MNTMAIILKGTHNLTKADLYRALGVNGTAKRRGGSGGGSRGGGGGSGGGSRGGLSSSSGGHGSSSGSTNPKGAPPAYSPKDPKGAPPPYSPKDPKGAPPPYSPKDPNGGAQPPPYSPKGPNGGAQPPPNSPKDSNGGAQRPGLPSYGGGGGGRGGPGFVPLPVFIPPVGSGGSGYHDGGRLPGNTTSRNGAALHDPDNNLLGLIFLLMYVIGLL